MSEKAPSPSHEQPSRDDIIEDFENRRTELTDQIDNLDNQPGFKMNGEQIIRRRQEKKLSAEALAAFTSEYSQLGGDAVDDAQKAVDSLDFRSSAEDHIKAKTALRDAKDAFHANYVDSQNTEAEASPTEPSVDETDDELSLGARAAAGEFSHEQPTEAPAFSVGQEVTVVRNVYKDGKIIDRDGKIETGWKVDRINVDGTYTVALENGTDHNGDSGRLLKTVDAETLATWQQIETETHDAEVRTDAEALASKLEQSSAPEVVDDTHDTDANDDEHESDAEHLSFRERLAARKEYREYRRELKERAKNVKKIRNEQKKQLRREIAEKIAQENRTKAVLDYNNEQLEGRVKKSLIGSILRRLKSVRRSTEVTAETIPDNIVSLDEHRNLHEKEAA